MTSFYDNFILPHAMNLACGYKKIAKIRKDVVPQAQGVVIEFGIGSGYNLKHYNPDRVRRVIGIDPSPKFQALGKARFDASPVEVELVEARAEATGLPSSMADTVVVTYTLCSVEQVVLALGEARRLLKPTGKLLFLEHGLAPDEKIAARQELLSPLTVRFAGGCHLTRNVEKMILDAGFTFDWLERRWVKKMPKTSSFQYLGAASVR